MTPINEILKVLVDTDFFNEQGEWHGQDMEDRAVEKAKQSLLHHLLKLPELQDEGKQYPEDAKHMHANRTIRIFNFQKDLLRKALTTAILGEQAEEDN